MVRRLQSILMLLPFVLISAAPAMAGDEQSLRQALALLDSLDSTYLSVEYRYQPLDSVLQDLHEQTGIPFQLDAEALAAVGVYNDASISLTYRRASLATILAALTLSLGDGFDRPVYEAFGGMIVITTLDATSNMTLPEVYDVRDLLARPELLDRLAAEHPLAEPADEPQEPSPAAPSGDAPSKDDEAEPEEEPSPADERDASDDGPPDPAEAMRRMLRAKPIDLDQAKLRTLTPGERLLNLVLDHVDPDAWLEFGGSRARFTEQAGVVFVAAPASLHRRLRDALERLRSLYPQSVAFDVTFIELPRHRFARLQQRHPAGRALARSVLRDEEASRRWSAQLAASLDQSVRYRGGAGDAFITLDLAPTFDFDTGTLLAALSFESDHADDRRALTTTVSFSKSDPALLLELPAATATDSIQLLVVIARPY